MSALWINIITFGLVLGTIAVLYIVLQLCKYEHIIWKIGLFSCMILEGLGTILIFIPEYFKYAALCRVSGVFIMVTAVCVVRYRKADGWEMERVKRSDYLIRAGAALLIAGFIGTPFFSVLNTQQQVKSSQISIVGLLSRILEAVNRLNENLDREHDERLAQAKKDSVIRKNIIRSIEKVDGKVSQSLGNDVQVKRTLRRTNAVNARPALIINAPTPRSSLVPNPSPLNPDKVQDVPIMQKRGRKFSFDYGDTWFDPDSLARLSERRKNIE